MPGVDTGVGARTDIGIGDETLIGFGSTTGACDVVMVSVGAGVGGSTFVGDVASFTPDCVICTPSMTRSTSRCMRNVASSASNAWILSLTLRSTLSAIVFLSRSSDSLRARFV